MASVSFAVFPVFSASFFVDSIKPPLLVVFRIGAGKSGDRCAALLAGHGGIDVAIFLLAQKFLLVCLQGGRRPQASGASTEEIFKFIFKPGAYLARVRAGLSLRRFRKRFRTRILGYVFCYRFAMLFAIVLPSFC